MGLIAILTSWEKFLKNHDSQLEAASSYNDCVFSYLLFTFVMLQRMCNYVIIMNLLVHFPFQAMMEELNSAQPAVEQVNTDADDLLSHMHEKARSIPQRFAELNERIAQRQAKVQDEVQHGASFRKAVKDLEDWISGASEKVDAQKGVSPSSDAVAKQLNEMEVIVMCNHHLNNSNHDCNSNCQNNSRDYSIF